jgi:hypothetical protein
MRAARDAGEARDREIRAGAATKHTAEKVGQNRTRTESGHHHRTPAARASSHSNAAGT